MVQSLWWLRDSNGSSIPSAFFRNASIKAIRSGDIGAPGASGGPGSGSAANPPGHQPPAAAGLLPVTPSSGPAERDPSGPMASRRVSIGGLSIKHWDVVGTCQTWR